MNIFLIVLGVLIILDISYFAFVNQSVMLSVNYKPFLDTWEMPSGLLYFLLGIYGVIGGVAITYSKIIDMQKEIKKLKRKTEKSSISSEENEDKVKALEAKVKTLEIALKDALNK